MTFSIFSLHIFFKIIIIFLMREHIHWNLSFYYMEKMTLIKCFLFKKIGSVIFCYIYKFSQRFLLVKCSKKLRCFLQQKIKKNETICRQMTLCCQSTQLKVKKKIFQRQEHKNGKKKMLFSFFYIFSPHRGYLKKHVFYSKNNSFIFCERILKKTTCWK